MFGESYSESPRAQSPWDSLTSAPSTPLTGKGTLAQEIPRLTPEVEEGNVEYKLQLLAPSPARFVRLVTQLKWRLLEGGGQAYYEIGVADSGSLVGLPRLELEESLETLEAMAGEIGASVIVVKEVEVSPALSGIAQSQLRRWESRRRKRKDMLKATQDLDSAAPPSTTDPETEVPTTDTAGAEDIVAAPTSVHCAAPAMPPSDCTSMGLEICSVYKPRPTRRRPKLASAAAPNYFNKRGRQANRKRGSLIKQSVPPSALQDAADASTTEHGEGGGTGALAESRTIRAKASSLKFVREKRRGLKSDALLTRVCTTPRPITSQDCGSALLESSFEGLCVASDSLTTAPQEIGSPAGDAQVVVGGIDYDNARAGEMKNARLAANESRVIVEALVVRKMSLDDSFFDFGGFSF